MLQAHLFDQDINARAHNRLWNAKELASEEQRFSRREIRVETHLFTEVADTGA